MIPLVITLTAGLLVVLWLWRQSTRQRQHLLRSLQVEQRALVAKNQEALRLAAGLGGAADGLVVLDEAGCIVAANAAAQELANLPQQDSCGRRLEELVPWPKLHGALLACRQSAALQIFELDPTTGNGRTLAVRVRGLPGLGVVVGIDDESRLKRLESLRRDFVANVSHELKTPLAAILGFVETMLDDADMPVAVRQRFLEKIVRQSERLGTLVADLLTLSRLDEDVGMDRGGEVCDLAEVVRETLRDLASLAERHALAIVAVLPDRAVWVRAEREALRQVAGNLIDNAIKYTPAGGRVTVQLAAREGRALLEVMDTGIGLSPADQERVFERFYRVDRARSRELGGTGLGLSIVKNTVRNLGGEVGVRSTLGQGSTFWVGLPQAEVQGGDPDLATPTG